MARKFNNGRLGEHLMNNEMFLAYNRIKYLGNGFETPVQERQAEIPNYSLWLDRKSGHDVLKAWDEVQWNPLFEGYYHPADLTVQPANPIPGQLYIDTNGVLRYYHNNQWKVVSAAAASNLSYVDAGLANFMIMPDMATITGMNKTYHVPLAADGKLFDNKKYVPRNKYASTGVEVRYPINNTTPKEKVSWVHVNPTFLYNADKRLIKVVDKTDWFINVTTTNTEFYGFKLGNPVGTFLRHIEEYGTGDITDTTDTVSDYKPVSGGIQLINNGRKFDYIYAITYNFEAIDNTFGYMFTGNATIGTDNDVFVGQINDFPLVFLDGTYMEQEDYTYDKTEGMLSFSGETITNESDLVVAAFAQVLMSEETGKPFELEVNGNNITVDGNLVKQHNYLKNVSRFEHPIVFVQGVGTLYDQKYGITDEVEINTNTGIITVKNFGAIPKGDAVNICIADIGAAKLSSGNLTADGKILDENIGSDKKYLAFVNGICTSPSDHEVTDGCIKIDKANDIVSEENRYVLMSLDKGDEGIDLLFDSSISYFTFQINDSNENTVYNDCDMVVSYVYNNNDTVNGILIDYNHMQSNISNERAYATGEILKVKDTNNSDVYNYEYMIYNVHGDFRWTDYDDEYGIDERNKLDKMITQFKGDGSISIMNNETLAGKTIEYYAYTYADAVDEPILKGTRNCRIAFKDHAKDANIPDIQNYSTDRIQYYSTPNKGVLGTYINGVQTKNVDIVDNNGTPQGKFSIDTMESISFKKTWGTKCDLYPLLKRITDSTSLADLQVFKDGEFANQLKDYSLTPSLLTKLKSLASIINETETKNELFYFLEKMERNEAYSVNRDWLGHGNRFTNFDNAYTAVSYIGPGLVDVYLNGVMLDKSSYSIFNNNYILLNDLTVAGGSDEYNKDEEKSHRLIKYYIESYDKDTDKTDGQVYHVYCESPDELLVEYRPDVTLRKTSYEIKEISYDMNGVFPYDDYEFPSSLLNSKDEIKIWIDGILYTGGYYIEGKNIVLRNSPLRLDPIKEYFNAHPDTYKEWKKSNGEYVYTKSRIIFEWR